MGVLVFMITKGKIAVVLDAQAGSSAKGVISAYLTKRHRPDILMTANGRNSSHTVVDTTSGHHDKPVVFKVLPAGAFYNDSTYKPIIWIGPGAAFKPEDLFKEMEATGVTEAQVMIHPCASVVTADDIDYENGVVDFEGRHYPSINHTGGTTAHGTTGSGSGAARAKKSLRKGSVAKDCPALQPMISDAFPVISRIKEGASALMDGSQGYWLSLYGPFYPHTTSRATTLASFFSECEMPISLCGDVCAVARTFPIRINSSRYFHDGKPQTWSQVVALRESGIEPDRVKSDSGGWYPDQRELTWGELSKQAGCRRIQIEMTTLTQLPRRIATWSNIGFEQFLAQNTPPNGHVHLFLTFLNYLHPDEQKPFVAALRKRFPEVSTFSVSDSPETDSVVGSW